MIKPILSRLYWWAHNYTMRRQARKRLVMLESRLLAHDMDMVSMEHYPQPVQERMRAYRERLVTQIENARRVL
jgi:hypothetical protein